jgi:hypothetical protein
MEWQMIGGTLRTFRMPRLRLRVARAALLTACAAAPAAAQTDYYNTDAGRPVRIEDAAAVERYAFELQLAPLRLERSDAGAYTWEIEPELAYGILPRTQVEAGVPLILAEGADGESNAGIGGIALSVLHNLNTETAGLPAFALAAGVLLPVGGSAPDATYATAKAIATRTFRFARVHVNAEYTFGATPAVDERTGEAVRWAAGLAVDRAFPLSAALVIADVFAEQPLHESEDLVWTVEAGARYQLDPRFALDVGIGRRTGGEDRGWFFTFGAARAFAVRSLIPVGR